MVLSSGVTLNGTTTVGQRFGWNENGLDTDMVRVTKFVKLDLDISAITRIRRQRRSSECCLLLGCQCIDPFCKTVMDFLAVGFSKWRNQFSMFDFGKQQFNQCSICFLNLEKKWVPRQSPSKAQKIAVRIHGFVGLIADVVL